MTTTEETFKILLEVAKTDELAIDATISNASKKDLYSFAENHGLEVCAPDEMFNYFYVLYDKQNLKLWVMTDPNEAEIKIISKAK